MKWIDPLLRLLSAQRRARFRTAQAVYDRAVAQARRPEFYAAMGVPDTVEGRFDLLSLHVALICRRLARTGREGQDLAQALFDTMFADMEHNLREIGVSDTSLGRSVKTMAKGFLGRAEAYGRALSGDEPLETVLQRNLYAGGEVAPATVDAAARYVADAVRRLDACGYAEIAAAGDALFPAPDAATGTPAPQA
jgi:cytochrome b pre-mRNA-processing protein 3